MRNTTANGKYTVITMGTFDGVHIGHKQLINKVIERSLQHSNGESVVVSYHNHPKEVIDKEIPPYLLTEKTAKEQLVKNLGVDKIIFLHFDEQMHYMSAEDFLKKFLHEQFQAREIVFGYDCHFGYLRRGDYHFLEAHKEDYSYTPLMIEPVKIDGQIVSSSLIRGLISDGDVGKAAVYLDRCYDVYGTVVEGEKIGRRLGFPTININPVERLKLIPKKGVYIGKVHLRNRCYYALTNVGISPTLKKNNATQIECHLLEFDGVLNEQTVRVEFLERIRDEIKFADSDELVANLNKDKQFALKYIQSRSTAS